jgi:hypothetical protein
LLSGNGRRTRRCKATEIDKEEEGMLVFMAIILELKTYERKACRCRVLSYTGAHPASHSVEKGNYFPRSKAARK